MITKSTVTLLGSIFFPVSCLAQTSASGFSTITLMDGSSHVIAGQISSTQNFNSVTVTPVLLNPEAGLSINEQGFRSLSLTLDNSPAPITQDIVPIPQDIVPISQDIVQPLDTTESFTIPISTNGLE